MHFFLYLCAKFLFGMKKLLFLGVLLTLLFPACSKQHRASSVAPVPVSVMTIYTAADTTIRHYVGAIESDTKVDLTFPMGGTLTQICVSNGQTVHRGDLIAAIDDTRARSMHEASLATLRQAEDAYDRMRKVYEQGGISEVRWMQMETDLAKAQQSELSSRKSLDDCRMISPVDGVVDIHKASVGSHVRPAEAFASVQSVDVMNVRYTIPEQEIDRIEIGDRICVEIPALHDTTVEAKVIERSLVANPMGHTYTICARLARPVGALPGMVAKVSMAKTGSVGVVIPTNCIITVYDGQVVWIVRDSVAVRQHIECSDLVRNGVLVSSGLADGDIVVIDGYQKLYPGAKVTY